MEKSKYQSKSATFCGTAGEKKFRFEMKSMGKLSCIQGKSSEIIGAKRKKVKPLADQKGVMLLSLL